MDNQVTTPAMGDGIAPPAVPPRSRDSPPQPPPRNEQSPPMSSYAPAEPGSAASTAFNPPPPPQRRMPEKDDILSPDHFVRDPHKLVAYLVPFPTPKLNNIPSERVPQRFLIYTPPPPPLSKPGEGEKEGKVHKVQRKWQEEVREAKTQSVKTLSWKGIKGNATKVINKGINYTTTSNLDFLSRVGHEGSDKHADDGHKEGEQTNKTVQLEEMVLVHPTSMPGDSAQLRQEFVNTMLRSKSKAERDAIIATGLLPVSAAIDIAATLVWPFGGLLEIDSVWLYASIQGAKTSRSVTKRLASSSTTNDQDKDKLELSFVPSSRLAVLEKYLAWECHRQDGKLFPSPGVVPTETQVLEAVGWSPSSKGFEERNWEDEQWEITSAKDDMKNVMHKAAKEWEKWVKMFEKDPEKAMKK